MFYLSWKSQFDNLSDKELRRFVNNLIYWHQDEEVDLRSKTDRIVWNGVLPALEINLKKYEESAERSRNNGKKSNGRPKKEQETQQDFDKPTKPDNSKELSVNSKLLKVDSEKLIDNCELEIEKSNIVNTGISSGNYFKNKIEELTTKLEVNYPHYPFLISMANPSGIKELKNHINNEEEFDSIIKILKELAESKKQYRGKYE